MQVTIFCFNVLSSTSALLLQHQLLSKCADWVCTIFVPIQLLQRLQWLWGSILHLPTYLCVHGSTKWCALRHVTNSAFHMCSPASIPYIQTCSMCVPGELSWTAWGMHTRPHLYGLMGDWHSMHIRFLVFFLLQRCIRVKLICMGSSSL